MIDLIRRIGEAIREPDVPTALGFVNEQEAKVAGVGR